MAWTAFRITQFGERAKANLFRSAMPTSCRGNRTRNDFPSGAPPSSLVEPGKDHQAPGSDHRVCGAPLEFRAINPLAEPLLASRQASRSRVT